jgi:hypothetical protein
MKQKKKVAPNKRRRAEGQAALGYRYSSFFSISAAFLFCGLSSSDFL